MIGANHAGDPNRAFADLVRAASIPSDSDDRRLEVVFSVSGVRRRTVDLAYTNAVQLRRKLQNPNRRGCGREAAAGSCRSRQFDVSIQRPTEQPQVDSRTPDAYYWRRRQERMRSARTHGSRGLIECVERQVRWSERMRVDCARPSGTNVDELSKDIRDAERIANRGGIRDGSVITRR